MRHNPETVDLLKDYVIQLHRYGHLDSVMTEVPAADGLTTAYRFQGRPIHTHTHTHTQRNMHEKNIAHEISS